MRRVISYLESVLAHSFTSLLRDDLHQLVAVIGLRLQVVFGHGSRDDRGGLVLAGQLRKAQDTPGHSLRPVVHVCLYGWRIGVI